MPIVDEGDNVYTALRSAHHWFRFTLVTYDVYWSFLDLGGNPVPSTTLTDRLKAFQISNSIDNAAAQATFTLALGPYYSSLSALIPGPYVVNGQSVIRPGLGIGLWCEVFTDAGTMGQFTLFRGRIDRTNYAAGNETVQLQCRDEAGFFLNDFIDAGFQTTTADLRDACRQILTNQGIDSTELGGPLTGYDLFGYWQEPMGTMEALRANAQKIGWDIRCFPGDLAPLRLYDPDRERFVPDDIIPTSLYTSINELTYDDADVRNWWKGFLELEDGSVIPVGGLVVEDLASQQLYGFRPSQLYVRRAEGIVTEERLGVLLNAALQDSKDPIASHSIEMPFYPIVTLNDIQQYDPNNRQYTSPQTFCVVAYTHEWHVRESGESDESAMPTTTIQARAQPMAARREYRLSKQPDVLVSDTTAPLNPALEAADGTIHFSVDLSTPLAMAAPVRARARAKPRSSSYPGPINSSMVIAGKPIIE